MRFKLDENLPVELAAELGAMGHDTDADEGLAASRIRRSLKPQRMLIEFC